MLCNAKALQELGYSIWMIKGIKRAGKAFGDNPFIGNYAYEEDLRVWLHQHPDFVASQSLRGKWPSPAMDNPLKAKLSSPVGDHHAGIDETPPPPQAKLPQEATPHTSAVYGKIPRKRSSRRPAVISLSPEWEACRRRILGRRSGAQNCAGAA